MPEIDLSDLARDGGGSPNLRAYLARPEGEGPWPGVVVAHEVFGADEQMRRHADRMARAGYLTVLPDLYSDGGGLRCVRGVVSALGAGHGRAFTDLLAGRDWLRARNDCTGRVGVLGFCLGGGFAIASAPDFDASAPNYGYLPGDLQAVAARSCPVVASYAGRDRTLVGAADRLRGALREAGVPNDVKEYPDAGHSFLNEAPNGPKPLRVVLRAMGTGPHPESAADAWERIGSFFAEHLGGEREAES
ncbi:carboxymethylenebutenolidase [Nocardiopsis terrae]|uniref:Carboxymethylenebutenolidase n=1 Tax=Nocardiopsis terrae TaxID=372655 RepID=A0ABR9HN31_9ACTN|nr:dienelactone hydrolase family protein [Nocardiopsis terrae]MBE1460396.1 carboxymethylenebutenolidase [Nocardiopsis terrae]GHC71243.1 carboxymethylenebutenolidase [Nocardiopsis terrae]